MLDECTDAVSADAETDLYKAMFDKNITCITISKRLALTDFHEKQLQLGEGFVLFLLLYDELLLNLSDELLSNPGVSNTNGWKLVTSL